MLLLTADVTIQIFFFFLFEGGEIGRYKRAWWPFCDSERTLKYHFDSHASQNVSGLYVPINKTDLNFQHLAEAFFILTQFSQESSFRVLLLPYSSCELWRVFSHGCFLGGGWGVFFLPFLVCAVKCQLEKGKTDKPDYQGNSRLAAKSPPVLEA